MNAITNYPSENQHAEQQSIKMYIWVREDYFNIFNDYESMSDMIFRNANARL